MIGLIKECKNCDEDIKLVSRRSWIHFDGKHHYYYCKDGDRGTYAEPKAELG